MWSPLSLILEALTKARLYWAKAQNVPAIGASGATDALGGETWKRFATARTLFEIWAPALDSPFEPYHCVTLFAALDRANIAPHPLASSSAQSVEAVQVLRPTSELLDVQWLTQSTMVVIDLFGPSTVALGARFVQRGCQPVCTFDNWPHPRAVLKPQFTLAALLRHAPVVAAARPLVQVASPPVWLCDRSRLVGSRPSPGGFDNRYYLDDTLLPGTQFLQRNGIGRIVVIGPARDAVLSPDLNAWLADRARDGLEVFAASVDDPHLDVRPVTPKRTHFPRVGSRSDAGGFGSLVPEPSSSGG